MSCTPFYAAGARLLTEYSVGPKAAMVKNLAECPEMVLPGTLDPINRDLRQCADEVNLLLSSNKSCSTQK